MVIYDFTSYSYVLNLFISFSKKAAFLDEMMLELNLFASIIVKFPTGYWFSTYSNEQYALFLFSIYLIY